MKLKKINRSREIKVNDIIVTSPKTNINEISDNVTYNDNKLEYKEFRYYILNKKSWVYNSSRRSKGKTFMELLPSWGNQKI